jgi:RNA recognition motif-containing protein
MDPILFNNYRPYKEIENSNKKLFLGGLSQITTKSDIVFYFQTFGQIDSVELIFDKQSNQSRGFGFLTMANEESISNILVSKPHFLLNKQIDCKLAVPKSCPKVEAENDDKNNDENLYKRKIFLGGLGKKLTEREIVKSFIGFGEISKCFIKRKNGISRGFGFIVFKDEESVEKVFNFLQKQKIIINGTLIQCKRAFPRLDMDSKESSQKSRSIFNEKLLFIDLDNQVNDDNIQIQMNFTNDTGLNFDLSVFNNDESPDSSTCCENSVSSVSSF